MVIDEDGERRLCGIATHIAAGVYDTLDEGLADLGPSGPAELSALMPPPWVRARGRDHRQVIDVADEVAHRAVG